MKNKLQRGFTLVELVIVIVIIAILTSIALPAYRDYVLRGRLTEAFSGLATLQTQAEQYWSDNRTYLGYSVPATYNTANFNFTASNLSQTTFLITATGGASIGGATYSIDQNNTRRTVSAPSGWTVPGAACWSNKRNGDCIK